MSFQVDVKSARYWSWISNENDSTESAMSILIHEDQIEHSGPMKLQYNEWKNKVVLLSLPGARSLLLKTEIEHHLDWLHTSKGSSCKSVLICFNKTICLLIALQILLETIFIFKIVLIIYRYPLLVWNQSISTSGKKFFVFLNQITLYYNFWAVCTLQLLYCDRLDIIQNFQYRKETKFSFPGQLLHL